MTKKQVKIPLLNSKIGAPIKCKTLKIPLITKLHIANTPVI